MSSNPYADQIAATESKYAIPPGLLNQTIATESGYNPNAFNPASGATGIAQILPSTAADPGYGIAPVNPNDPNASIDFAGQYLKAMFDKTGSWTGAVQAYGTVGQVAQNSNQTQLLQIANAADNGGSGVTGTSLTGSSLQNVAFGVAPSTSGGATTGPTGAAAAAAPGVGYPAVLGLQSGVIGLANSLAASVGDAFKQAMSGLLSGIENWVTRGFLIFIGIVLVAVAAYRLLAPNVPLKDAIALAA